VNKSKTPVKEKRPKSKAKDPFTLPRAIAKQLRVCAQAHEQGTLFPQGAIKYLWVNLADVPDSGLPTHGKGTKGLTCRTG